MISLVQIITYVVLIMRAFFLTRTLYSFARKVPLYEKFLYYGPSADLRTFRASRTNLLAQKMIKLITDYSITLTRLLLSLVRSRIEILPRI